MLEALLNGPELPAVGDTIRLVTRRGGERPVVVRGRMHVVAAELTIEQDGETQTQSWGGASVYVEGLPNPRALHRDERGWYVCERDEVRRA